MDGKFPADEPGVSVDKVQDSYEPVCGSVPDFECANYLGAVGVEGVRLRAMCEMLQDAFFEDQDADVGWEVVEVKRRASAGEGADVVVEVEDL